MRPLIRTLVSFAVVLAISPRAASAQNCARTSTGYPPISDLGAGLYKGFTGGLYRGGSNTDTRYETKSLSESVVPLDTNGKPDPVNGKIVMISIGMSNTTQESQAFSSMLDTFKLKNPRFVFIDCAEGGVDVVKMTAANTTYWAFLQKQLKAKGATTKQVQLWWVKQAYATPAAKDSVFPRHVDTMVKYLTTIAQTGYRLMPNTKIAYLSSRIYAGYASSSLNPEPYAYQTGWAVKWLIEKQSDGDTSLSYKNNPKVPYLAWGPYLWADGLNPRLDGLTWKCPDDYQSDGTHPSATGRVKVAALLLNHFTNDPYAKSWFLAPSVSSVTLRSPADSSKNHPLTEVLRWNALSGAAHYELQIERNQSFTLTAIQQIDGSITSFNTDSLSEGATYYWHVRAVTSDGSTTAWSPTWSFTTAVRLTTAPKLISPANGSLLSNAPSTYCWEPVEGATRYTFKPTSTFTSNTCIYESNLINWYSTWYWSVVASNALGDSPESETWSYTVDPRTHPSVIYPPNGAKDVPLPIYFRWSGNGSDEFTVATDSALEHVVAHGTAVNNMVGVLDIGRQYYWAGYYSGNPDIGPGEWTPVATFTVGTGTSSVATTSANAFTVELDRTIGKLYLKGESVTGHLTLYGTDILGRMQTVTIDRLSAGHPVELPASLAECIYFRLVDGEHSVTIKRSVKE